MAIPQHICQLLDTMSYRIKSPNNVKMCVTQSLANKNHQAYSESEHSDDENEWEISGIVRDIAIKWQYFDAKNHELIVSDHEHSTISKIHLAGSNRL